MRYTKVKDPCEYAFIEGRLADDGAKLAVTATSVSRRSNGAPPASCPFGDPKLHDLDKRFSEDAPRHLGHSGSPVRAGGFLEGCVMIPARVR